MPASPTEAQSLTVDSSSMAGYVTSPSLTVAQTSLDTAADVATGAVLSVDVEVASSWAVAAPPWRCRAQQIEEAACAVARIRAVMQGKVKKAVQMRTEASTAEREEWYLEETVREHVEVAMSHATKACAVQEQADELQASLSQEREVRTILTTELNSLEVRLVGEERRAAHELRVRGLNLQVTEAATEDIIKSCADFAVAVHHEEEEDSARHAATMRRLRLANHRRFVSFEEEETTRRRAQRLEEAQAASRLADARSASLFSSLRSQHAAETQRLNQVKEALAAELQELVALAEGCALQRSVEGSNLAQAEAETHCLHKAASMLRSSAIQTAARGDATERQLEQMASEDAALLADAESHATQQQEFHSNLDLHAHTLELRLAALQHDHVVSEARMIACVEDLHQRLSRFTETAEETEAKTEMASWELITAESRLANLRLQPGMNEDLASAETSFVAEAAMADVRNMQAFANATSRQQSSLGRLAALRLALREQHEAAEAEHEEVINSEAEAEQMLTALMSQQQPNSIC